MLSVLIPTYNHSVDKLVQKVHTQLNMSKINFEIIVLEDGSTKNINAITHLSHMEVLVHKHNLGRVKARQFLAKTSKYDWLLFLDADVLPKNDNFISNYIGHLKLGYEAVFGGFTYYDEKPKKDYVLRWKYGKAREQVPAHKRNKNPYKVIISANYLIKKTVFETINSKMTKNGYGYDNYFGSLLKLQQINILHIDNEVYHLGIEKSSNYLSKKEQAAETLIRLYNANTITTHDNDLLALFSNLKRLGMTAIFSGAYKLLRPLMQYNLTGSNPSIKMLQLYRISYMCYISRNRMPTVE